MNKLQLTVQKLKSIPPFALVGWFFASSTATIVFLLFLVLNPSIYKPEITPKYAMFSAKPMVMGYATSDLTGGDARAAKINKIFEFYKCPIAGTGEIFVKEADKYGIPYWIVAAIAFQESSCGKNVPVKNGELSNNLWGWAVYGDNVKMFDDLEHGVEVVTKYMHERFFSQGITEPCEIMKVYTPPSKGSWCEGVKFFRDEIDEYSSPAPIRE